MYESQYGFRKNRSYQNDITQLISNLLKNTEIGLTTAGIFIDLTKAFDTLDHEILLKTGAVLHKRNN